MAPTEWLGGYGTSLPTDYGTGLGWGLIVGLMCWLALLIAVFAVWRYE